ncbi:LysR family transcriptional regulator [Massilia sp. CCM 8733]|uniref:LysR family transcriptional regulator n=1 Tax=Massilia mucilaginosa TaxID=2609282 RepID=A0ABX0P5T9_9BURK|nr:LysR family transcriptional regulator [Massilia mucilaginosa]NHZ93792.1 LysR family transcriptional regulator [Massilia mucilaginosa]
MGSVAGINVFVLVAETRNFSEAGRRLGVSSSAVGKSIARMEERLGVRLFHRNTRNITPTAEGLQFLERCRRILCEIEAAELDLSNASSAPRGKLRVSLPRYSGAFEAAIAEFMRAYPAVELDLDFSDRLVDVIRDGFDVAIRTGELHDSGLKRRRLGSFRRLLVASPAYLAERGTPVQPPDLLAHTCLHYRFPSTGRLEQWPLGQDEHGSGPELPLSMVCNSIEMRLFLALRGQGIAYAPDFTVTAALAAGRLHTVLDAYARERGTIWALWPASRHVSPKLGAFIDFLSERVFPEG